MAMSDCIKCWSTPCTCGWEYAHAKRDTRIKKAALVLGVEKSVLDKIMDEIPEVHPMLSSPDKKE